MIRPVGKSRKFRMVLHEWGKGTLHSGSKSGPKVTSQKQALAIAFNQARQAAKK